MLMAFIARPIGCFSRQNPSPIVNLQTKCYDDRAKGVGVISKPRPIGPPQSGSFILESCLFIPQSHIPNLVLIESIFKSSIHFTAFHIMQISKKI